MERLDYLLMQYQAAKYYGDKPLLALIRWKLISYRGEQHVN